MQGTELNYRPCFILKSNKMNRLLIIMICCIGITLAMEAQNVFHYRPAADTITNTESDTLTWTFHNYSFDYCWNLEITTGISGTDSLTVVIEETASPSSSTAWKQVGSTVTLGATGSANRIALITGRVYGVKQRILITGVGTQSTIYRLWSTFRKRA